MIFYFSGTGNSTYVAKRIARVTGDPLCSLNEKIRDGSLAPKDIAPDERLIFVVPIYGWRIPRIVEDWIRRSAFPRGCQAYFVMTCGSDMGNADKYIKKLCAANAFAYMGCAEIVMPENYIALFTTPGREEALEIIERSEPSIVGAANQIAQGKPLSPYRPNIPDRIKSSLVNTLFYPTMVHAKKFYVTDPCTGCGLCAKNCPLNNVQLTEGRPVWSGNCTHCMACICRCPVEAIEYGRHSHGLPRYQCPL